ncbi:MAG: biotin/lipoyl-containing protein, partial [Pseudomonadota bacterium]
AKLSASKWAAIQSSHVGYQLGLELINALVMIADSIKFYSLKVNKDLTINIPDALTDEQLQADMNKVLVPPPAASGDEILAVSGGMFYSREAPGMNPFVSVGDHFEAGEPLYIVEVMKMFNRVNAPFSGTIEKTLIDLDGAIISKGQPLFKIVPDEKVVIETEEEAYARQTAFTDKLLKKMNK